MREQLHTHKSLKLTGQPTQTLQVVDFSPSEVELKSTLRLNKEVFAYFMQKLAMQHTRPEVTIKSLREFILPTAAQLKYSDPSQIYYMELIDENADCKETMTEVSELVLERLLSGTQDWVVLVGDGKTYEHLREIKRLYGSTFEQLLIFPGDWHILKNYQPVLMKAYYHAGLKQIAKESGYRAETLASLEKCSHFKRTHFFLLQVWESMLTEMLSAFLKSNPQQSELLTILQTNLTEAIHNGVDSHSVLLSAQELISEAQATDGFKQFLYRQAKIDSTWQLWTNFVFNDCFCYVGLFIAIRTSNWDLRLASLKEMGPLFAAYDRPFYQKILPHHIADIQCYPQDILECLKEGGFTVKLNEGIGHAIALDEAHEMCINRDLKMAVARPTLPYLRKTNFFFSYRIKAQKQLTTQLFPTSQEETGTASNTIVDTTATTKHWNANVISMQQTISGHNLLPHTTSERGIVNEFTGVKATPEQAHDMLKAREIGENHYKHYITHHIIQLSSSNAPVRKQRLLTMAPLKATKLRMSQKEREERETNKYLRRRLEWCNRTGQTFDEEREQYTLLPRALADHEGNPHKGPKSKWTDKLKARYSLQESTPFSTSPPQTPDTVIIDAMFPINTTPLRQHKTLTDFAQFLLKVYVLPHFGHGSKEVHLVFDSPERLSFNPKTCEHKRRYEKRVDTKDHTHTCITAQPQSLIPRPWREYLKCQKCKRSIVEAIGWAYLRTAQGHLKEGQVFILAGCFSDDTQDDAWRITGDTMTPPHTTNLYSSNAQEADMRMWRHATQSESTNILICSADTDVYNIGLVHVMAHSEKHFVVQTHYNQYVDVGRLISSFQCDPDLASLPQSELGPIMLQLYAVTGCDYISFVSGISKATFLNLFFQHADFITGEQSKGHLSCTETQTMQCGFMACIRLVGTAYFKRHLATMVSRLGYETPNQLYNSIGREGMCMEDHHKEWYLRIRSSIRVLTEDQRPPTITALWKHWSRACWIMEMWKNSTQRHLYLNLPEPEKQGWLRNDSGYSIDWEAGEVKKQIQATLDFLSKGCSCKTGCTSRRCGCRKMDKTCGAGCECRGCTNVSLTQQQVGSEEGESESDTESDDSVEQLEAEVITDNFDFDDAFDTLI